MNVAPVELKILSAIAGQFPGFAEKVQRRAGADPTIRQMVDAQRGKR